MSADTPRGRHTEAGNAVALTLLGLAVAILAGVVVLYVLGKSSHQPIYTPEIADEEVMEVVEEKKSREGWGTYVNDIYEFSFEYPSGWVVATGTLSTGEPVVSVFPAVATSTTSNVVSLGEVTSHVSVYPHGAETEEKFGKMHRGRQKQFLITVLQVGPMLVSCLPELWWKKKRFFLCGGKSRFLKMNSTNRWVM